MTLRHFFSLDHDPAADGDFTVPAAEHDAMVAARDQSDAEFWASLRASGAPIAAPEANPEPGSFAEQYAEACAALDGGQDGGSVADRYADAAAAAQADQWVADHAPGGGDPEPEAG